MRLRFAKYEGLGNDFLVVERTNALAQALDTKAVRTLCDRHFGVGGDGVLLVDVEAPSMRVLNADGSIPEMCGNGLRCVALHLVRKGLANGRFDVETDAGLHVCDVVLAGEGECASVEVEMRVPSLVPSEVPVLASAPLIDATLDVLGRTVVGTAVSMGNPHFVTFDDVGDARLTLGPALERDPRFPQGVNVGFATMRDGDIDLAVFERGAGWTMACGTGACAAAVAAVETGRAERGMPIEVHLPGGTLVIRVGAPSERVLMRGPAHFVFEGELDVSRLAHA
jgi:diaminopimelate epimerase